MTVSTIAATVLDDDDGDADDFVLVERGLLSTVRKAWRMGFGDQPDVCQWIAVKTATTHRRFSKQPHDVVKEVRLLASLSHPNVIPLFDHTLDQASSSMHLWMPFIPLSFADVLDSPSFSPSSLTTGFLVLAKSLTFQIISAIAYLHSPPQSIAHRDIKPRNVLLTEDGCAKLIDFGISWKSDETEEQRRFDLWPEGPEEMCTAVSTGPYRAPELLFGPKSYNAFATDLWSLGATLAELFTPLELIRSSSTPSDCDTDSSAESEKEDISNEPKPFIIPSKAHNALDDPDHEWKWVRKSLFDGTRGELGLLWSIFKIMGTPNDQTWPEFKVLSDARSVSFNQVPPVLLDSKFPNLPPQTTHPNVRSRALDFISKLLLYPPENRLRAQDALSHPFLASDEVPLLLPLDYTQRREGHDHLETQVVFDWDGMSLGDLLKQILALSSHQGVKGE